MTQLLHIEGVLTTNNQQDAENVYDKMIDHIDENHGEFYGGAYPMDEHNAFVEKHGSHAEEVLIDEYLTEGESPIISMQRLFDDLEEYLAKPNEVSASDAMKACVPSMVYETVGHRLRGWHG